MAGDWNRPRTHVPIAWVISGDRRYWEGSGPRSPALAAAGDRRCELTFF